MRIEIHKPFDHDDPNGKFKKGWVGIYDLRIKNAIKEGGLVRLWVGEEPNIKKYWINPVKWKKKAILTYRYFTKDEPMPLYCGDPEVLQEKEEEELIPIDARKKMLQVWKKVHKSI